MNDVEFSLSVEKRAALASFKEHNWSLEIETDEGGARFVVVKDNLGSPIRRIPELDLWDLSLEDAEKKGHLIKKSA